ncbi:hypothetical protein [Aquimarina algiphila]|uniref:hypothetical protein n=1 Tax=Aquimarina algiphila TaxID=2047982 RepID=UPI00232F87BB|nr:hypothetical protein [Aquimarina algiphila]
MMDIHKHNRIVKKLKEVYGDFSNLKTNNDNLNTRIYADLDSFNNEQKLELLDDELPILDCKLKNGNYLLATTKSLYSIYNGISYTMLYSDFSKIDRTYFFENGQLAEGKTRVFRYFLKKGDDFLYEIDSFYPADIVHNRLVLSMRFGKYDSPAGV